MAGSPKYEQHLYRHVKDLIGNPAPDNEFTEDIVGFLAAEYMNVAVTVGVTIDSTLISTLIQEIVLNLRHDRIMSFYSVKVIVLLNVKTTDLGEVVIHHIHNFRIRLRG